LFQSPQQLQAEMQLRNHYLIVMVSIPCYLQVQETVSCCLLSFTFTLKGKAISWEQTAGDLSENTNMGV